MFVSSHDILPRQLAGNTAGKNKLSFIHLPFLTTCWIKKPYWFSTVDRRLVCDASKPNFSWCVVVITLIRVEVEDNCQTSRLTVIFKWFDWFLCSKRPPKLRLGLLARKSACIICGWLLLGNHHSVAESVMFNNVLSHTTRSTFAVETLSVCPQQLHQQFRLSVREGGVGGEEEVEHILRCRHLRPQKLSALLDQHVRHILEDGVILGSCRGEHKVLVCDWKAP